MSNADAPLGSELWDRELAELLAERIGKVLDRRGPGHCMRVSDLDEGLMMRVCANLRQRAANRPENIVILAAQGQEGRPGFVTSTKLVELRNPDEQGRLRPRLLVFIPPTLRTSAEDSFGVATFEDLTFPDLYIDLVKRLLKELPNGLASDARRVFGAAKAQQWPFANDVAFARLLLSARVIAHKSKDEGGYGAAFGAALSELALIPDFGLFDGSEPVEEKIKNNIQAVRSLMDSPKSVRASVVDLGLADKKLEGLLFEFFKQNDVREPEFWTGRIASDAGWRAASFDRWKFLAPQSGDRVSVRVSGTDLDRIAEDEADKNFADLVGSLVLIPGQRDKIKVTFEVCPAPSQVEGLSRFLIQIFDEDGRQVGRTTRVDAWKGDNLVKWKNIDVSKVRFRDGWHVIRVSPQTKNGESLLQGADDSAPSDAEGGAERPWESERFYVKTFDALDEGEEGDERPKKEKAPKTPDAVSVGHARLKLQLEALKNARDPDSIPQGAVSWKESAKSKASALQSEMRARFGRGAEFSLVASKALKNIERGILERPRLTSSWVLCIESQTAGEPERRSDAADDSPQRGAFLRARAAFFEAVGKGAGELITQGFSFLDGREACLDYAQSYLDWVRFLTRQARSATGEGRSKRLRELSEALAIDSVLVKATDFRGRAGDAILLSPTHPLRSLWFAAWASLGADWVEKLKRGGKDAIAPVSAALLERLEPFAFPAAVAAQDGRLFLPMGNIRMFWAMYAPIEEENARSLEAGICAALGAPAPASGADDVSSQAIAERLKLYLTQRPYARELSLNVFNPGSGSEIAQALLILQKESAYADMRYDVRLFALDPDLPALGSELEAMLDAGKAAKGEGGAFSSPTGRRLFSKLDVAKYPLAAFFDRPERFAAHVSVFLDMFPPRKIALERRSEGSVSLHGLIQGYGSEFVDNDKQTAWRRWPIFGRASKGASKGGSEGGSEGETAGAPFALLADLSRELCRASCAVAASGSGFDLEPVETLELDARQRELIFDAHRVSDWALTVDRNMGVEFYDHGGRSGRPDYLIDYAPSTIARGARKLIVSSRSVEELQAALRPVLLERGLGADKGATEKILGALRSLSGQIALRLISAPSRQAETLGLALARLYLESQGALANQIIAPLDAHRDWYSQKDLGGEQDGAIGLRRTDLALFDLNLKARAIVCNLVEVKCYSQVGGVAAFNKLKESIGEQIAQSERVIQRRFDPARKSDRRPDWRLNALEFGRILRFYLERARRYGIFDDAAALEAQGLIDTLEDGYALSFRSCALVFDFDREKTESPENEVGIEYHRIGMDVIRALMDSPSRVSDAFLGAGEGAGASVEAHGRAIGPASASVSVHSCAPAVSPSPGAEEAGVPRPPLASVPKLSQAVFIAPERVRETPPLEPPRGEEGRSAAASGAALRDKREKARGAGGAIHAAETRAPSGGPGPHPLDDLGLAWELAGLGFAPGASGAVSAPGRDDNDETRAPSGGPGPQPRDDRGWARGSAGSGHAPGASGAVSAPRHDDNDETNAPSGGPGLQPRDDLSLAPELAGSGHAAGALDSRGESAEHSDDFKSAPDSLSWADRVKIEAPREPEEQADVFAPKKEPGGAAVQPAGALGLASRDGAPKPQSLGADRGAAAPSVSVCVPLEIHIHGGGQGLEASDRGPVWEARETAPFGEAGFAGLGRRDSGPSDSPAADAAGAPPDTNPAPRAVEAGGGGARGGIPKSWAELADRLARGCAENPLRNETDLTVRDEQGESAGAPTISSSSSSIPARGRDGEASGFDAGARAPFGASGFGELAKFVSEPFDFAGAEAAVKLSQTNPKPRALEAGDGGFDGGVRDDAADLADRLARGRAVDPGRGGADRIARDAQGATTEVLPQSGLGGESGMGRGAQSALSPEPKPALDAPAYGVMLGAAASSPQYGLLGERDGQKVALDLNGAHTISLFGVQGAGKSYTLGSIIEMALEPIPRVNALPGPLAAVLFHYSQTLDYAPEFTSMARANSVPKEIELLRSRYGAGPQALKDILILTPKSKRERVQAENPGVSVLPIAFSSSELKAGHWKFLMGAVGSNNLYMKKINLLMRSLRDDLTLANLRQGIETAGLSEQQKNLAKTRLDFAEEYVDDSQRLQDLIRPGRLLVVDLRDELIEKDEALGLFVTMLQIFSEATFKGASFNKLVVFDEAHKYLENKELIQSLVEVVREMRHKGTSILVASQDPPSVPTELIELSTEIVMHKFNSPAWLKHIQKVNGPLRNLTPESMSRLGPGDAYVWASKASDEAFSKGAVKIKCRPRVTQHGGATKTAVSGK